MIAHDHLVTGLLGGDEPEALVKRGDATLLGQMAELLLEKMDGKVDLDVSLASHEVIDQHDEAAHRTAHQLGGRADRTAVQRR